MTGTSRWVTIPTVELWTQEMECLETMTDGPDGGDIGMCEKFKATATVTDSNLKAIVQAIVNVDIPALTNNVLSGVRLTTKSHAAGTILNQRGCAVPNTIVVAYIGLGGTSGYNGGVSLADICWEEGDDGDRGFIKSGFIVLGGMYPANCETAAHEMAHVLGWMHRSRPEAVPRPSIMYPAGNTGLEKITSWDRQGGQVLYRERPVGSTAPDKDPPGNTINWPTPTSVYSF